MACTLLTNFTPCFKDANLIRSRNNEVIQNGNVVVDVGGVYDASILRYDHHQRGFSKTFSDRHIIKLSASGLVFLHHGKDCIKEAVKQLSHLGELPSFVNLEEVESRTEEYHESLYDSFFETLDAIDNGVSLVDSTVPKRYEPYKTDLAHRVARLNPPWWTETSPEIALTKFRHAMAL
jgi:uncharacterized UPF0160 family protein